MSKRIIYLSMLFFLNNTLKSQSTELEFQQYFDSKLGNMEKYEGIYTVDYSVTQSLESSDCQFVGYNNPHFDLIAIYRDDNNINVYSIKSQKSIGLLTIKQSGNFQYAGFQAISGPRGIYFSDESYNNLIRNIGDNLGFTLFNSTVLYKDIFNLLEYSIAKNINLKCNSQQVALMTSGLSIKADATRIYPNKTEKPKPITKAGGTGFIISKNGYIVTNHHIIKRQSQLVWWNWNWQPYGGNDDIPKYSNIKSDIVCVYKGNPYKLDIVDYNMGQDWAILKFRDSTMTFSDFIVFDTLKNTIGSEVYTLGFPMTSVLGNNIKYTNGYISSNQNINSYDVNMSINPGNSGGGLFNKQTGYLIGITSARYGSTNISIDGISISIKANPIVRVLKQNIVFSAKKVIDVEFLGNTIGQIGQTYRINKPQCLVKDLNYKPNVSIERNEKATVQIIAQ
jgi:S1-C subfamily serine protease